MQAPASSGCSLLECVDARCACGVAGGSALRQDGGCAEKTPAAAGSCAASHHVLFNVAAWGSPELRPGDVAAGVMSPPAENVLGRSIAAALGLGAGEVTVLDVNLTSVLSGDGGSLMHFDWAFRFCAAGRLLSPEDDPSGFEHRFGAEAQRYAMFRAATLRVLSLTPLLLPTGTPAPGPSAPGYGAGEAAGAAGPGDGRTLLQEFWWAPWVLAAAVLLAAPAAWLLLRRRRLLLEKVLGEFDGVADLAGAARGPDEAWVWEGALGHVVRDFDGPEAPGAGADEEAGFRQSCLRLSAGDVVEIQARTGAWLFGSVSGAPERGEGFFPEGCVAVWSGEACVGLPPLPAGPPAALASTGPLVRATCAFSPEEVAGGALPQELLLVLAGGEIAEVLAAGGGWLYGRLVAAPACVGYFPQDRVAWMDTNIPVETNSEAAALPDRAVDVHL